MVVMIWEHDSINCYNPFRKLFERSIKFRHMHMFAIYTCSLKIGTSIMYPGIIYNSLKFPTI